MDEHGLPADEMAYIVNQVAVTHCLTLSHQADQEDDLFGDGGVVYTFGGD